MKDLDPQFESHLAGQRLQLCTAIIFTLRDGQTREGYTDFQRPLTVDGVLCATTSVYTGSALEARADLSVGNAEFSAMLSSAGIDEAEVIGGKYDGARYDMYLVKFTAPILWERFDAGVLGKATVDQPISTIETRDLSQFLQGGIGEELSPTCRADLGDARCGVDLGPHTVTGTVDSIDVDRIAFTDASRTEPADQFAYGKITFATGSANPGAQMEVKSSASGGQIVLKSPLARNFDVGDAYSMYRGCNRLASTCKDVFDNLNRMRAELFVIGADELARFGRQ